MANNRIQIKRSPTTATPASLNAGELAFSNVTGGSGVLFIGSTDGATVVPIGGLRTPGTLTANQALVANSTSGINKIITANLTLSLGTVSVDTINAIANLTHLGAAVNTEITTTWAIKNYVDLKAAAASNPQGSNGQFQYNDSGVLNGTLNMTYNNTTNTVSIGNSTVNVQLGFTGSANSLGHFHGYQNGYVQVIMQNGNSQSRASSDWVATADNGDETTNYVDLGINSSTYDDPAYSAMGAGDSYLYAANNDLAIGTADAGEVRIFTGGTTAAQVRATVTSGGNVGIGNTTPNAKLQVTGTANISGLTTITANLVLGTGLTANGTGGTGGYVLKSGGAGANVYWDAPATGVAGTDTQVQFNDGGALAGEAGMTYNKTTDALTLAGAVNVGANVVVNTTMVYVGNSTVNADLSSSLLQVANSTTIANVTAAGIQVYTNSTVNSTHTASLVQVSNSTSTANLTALDLKIGATTTVNSTQVTATLLVGNVSGSYANITGQVNTATLYAATSANIASAVQANSTGVWTTGTVNAVNHTAGAGFGAATAGAVVNSGTIGISSNTTVNTVQTASLVQVSNATSIANLVATGLQVYTNSTVNSTVTAALLQVSNSTSTANLTALDLKIGATTVVNSSQITATLFSGNLTGSYANISGQVNTATLYAATSANIASVVQANSTGIWTTATANALNFTAGAGFNGASAGATVNSGTIGISSNTTVNSTHTAALLQVSNSTATSNLTAIGLAIGANNVANTTQFKIGNTNFTTTAATLGGTVSANGGVGTAGQILVSGAATNAYWSNSLGVFQFTDLTVSGNLTVLGDLVSLNVATLAVEDPLVVFAKDQSATATYTDAVDIGFVAPYGNTAVANANWTGLFRDQSDSGIYKLFSGNIPTPTTTVDTANLNFTFATLQAQLKTGGAGAGALIANSSHVNITANSTTNVFIVANTLSLSTALPVTSGGTGLNSVAVGDLLVGNSTNTLTRLASGTDGYVLQINGTGVVAWNTLDGGTF